MECPKCDGRRIFKASYVSSSSYQRGNKLYKRTEPRYLCVDCEEKFDTISYGEFEVATVNVYRKLRRQDG